MFVCVVCEALEFYYGRPQTKTKCWIMDYDPVKRYYGFQHTRFYCSECYKDLPEEIMDLLYEDKGYRQLNIVPKKDYKRLNGYNLGRW